MEAGEKAFAHCEITNLLSLYYQALDVGDLDRLEREVMAEGVGGELVSGPDSLICGESTGKSYEFEEYSESKNSCVFIQLLGCENGNSRPILVASPSTRLADIVSEFRPLSLGTLRGLTGHILTTIRPKELLCLISPRASGI